MKQAKKTIFSGLFLLLVVICGPHAQQDSKTEKYRKYSLLVNPIIYYQDIGGLFYGAGISFPFSLYVPPMYSSPFKKGDYSFIIEVEFQYALNKYITLSVEPLFGMGRGISWAANGFGYHPRFGAYFENNGAGHTKHVAFSVYPGLQIKPLGTGLKGWYIGVYPAIGVKHLSRDSYKITIGFTPGGDRLYTSYPSADDNFLELGIAADTGYKWIFDHGFTVSFGMGVRRTWDIASKNNTGRYDNSRTEPIMPVVNLKLGYSF